MNLILKDFKVLGKKGEGTFSEVLKCQRNQDQKLYACKKMKHTYSSIEQVNALREVQAMKRLSPHPFIVQLEDIVFDKRSGGLVLVLELMEMNLYEFIRGRKQYLSEHKICSLMWQMMKGIEHMHRLGIFHRDVKPENLLIRDERLKLADFGSCRAVKSQPPFTEYISTRWYRAPECLLTDGWYGAAMDIWSAGCVLFEVATLRPLFPGSNEVDQIAKIHEIIGTPTPELLLKFKGKSRHVSYNFAVRRGTGIDGLLSHASPQCAEAVRRMLEYDPVARPSARAVMRLAYFRDFKPTTELAAVLQQYQRQRKEAEENKENRRAGSSGTSEQQPQTAASATPSASSLPQLAAAGSKSPAAQQQHQPQQQQKQQQQQQHDRITPVLGSSYNSLSPQQPHQHLQQQQALQLQQQQQQKQHRQQMQRQQRRLRHRMGHLYGQAAVGSFSLPSLEPARHNAMAAPLRLDHGARQLQHQHQQQKQQLMGSQFTVGAGLGPRLDPQRRPRLYLQRGQQQRRS